MPRRAQYQREKRLRKQRESMAALKARRVAEGKCTVCDAPHARGLKMCEEHAQKHRDYVRKRSGLKAWVPGGLGRPPVGAAA